MILVLCALPLFCQSFQDTDAGTTRFYRVHLRNGNFVDGELVQNTSSLVLLRVKSGEMSFRREDVEYIEFVKMKDRRSVTERVKPPVEAEAPKSAEPPRTSAASSPVIAQTPPEIRRKVDQMVWKLRTTPGSEKSFDVSELSRLGDPGAMYLAARLPDLDPQTALCATSALINLKNLAVIPVLEPLLGHPAPSVRQGAAAALGTLAPDQKAQYLRPLLRDPDASVRGTALGLLGSVEDLEWFETLCELCNDRNPDIRSRSLLIASQIARKNHAEDHLIRILLVNLSFPDEGVRADTVMALSGLKKPEVWNSISLALGDSEPRVRAAAAQGLMNLAVPDSAPDILGQMSRERDKWTRVYLAGAAQRMHLLAATPSLIDWVSDSDPDVQKVAENTLKGFSGENFGTDRDKWAEWWSRRAK